MIYLYHSGTAAKRVKSQNSFLHIFTYSIIFFALSPPSLKMPTRKKKLPVVPKPEAETTSGNVGELTFSGIIQHVLASPKRQRLIGCLVENRFFEILRTQGVPFVRSICSSPSCLSEGEELTLLGMEGAPIDGAFLELASLI